MLFAGAGSLTEEGPIRYLPISGRNMSPTEGNGLLIPTRLVQDPDNGLIGIKEQGYLPQKGNVLLVEGVKGLGRTSDLVEVKMRYSVGDPGRDMGAQAMMASMTSLNEDWR